MQNCLPSYRRLLSFFLSFIFLFFCFSLQAQTVQELKTKKTKIKTEISYNKQLLNEINKEQETSLTELKILKKQLEQRASLINTLRIEIDSLDSSIQGIQTEVDSLKNRQSELRQQYADMIRYAYKTNNSYNVLLFLLSAESFNEAFKRMKYIKHYNDDKRKKVEQLTAVTDTLSIRILNIEEKKGEQNELLGNETTQKEKLDSEKAVLDKILKGLKKQEQKLRRTNDDKQAVLRQLDSEISSFINKDVAVTSEMPASPKLKALSANFAKNRGKLPWPVRKGVLISSFGKHAHPVVRGIYIENSGIDIATKQNTDALAIFEGEVSQILYSPSFQSAIIVKHGSYYSVYSNISDVQVAKGDKIGTQQKLGVVYTNPKTNKTVIHFEIWKVKEKRNPAKWISKR